MKIVDHTFHYLKKPKPTTDPIYAQYRKEWYDRVTERRPGEFPIHVDIETTTLCNLKCRMCFQSFDAPEPKVMDANTVGGIISQLVGNAYSIKLQYRGEPLTHKDTAGFIYAAKRVGMVEVMINTNANLLDDKTARKLISSGLDKLICSVEGSNAAIYNETRIGGNFDRVVSNIKNLIRLRNELGFSKPIVRVQMVRTESNSKDVKKFLKFWGKIADEVAVEDELDYRAEIDDRTELKDWACPQIYQRLIILADGDIVPCCRAIRGGTGKQWVLGNIERDTIQSVWTGDKLGTLRDAHEKGKSHLVDMCARCGLRKDMVKKVSG